MPVSGNPDNLHLGRTFQSPGEHIRGILREAADERFDFVVLPLATPGGQGSGAAFDPAFVDLALDANTWNTAVVGAVSDEVGPCGAREEDERRAWLDTELRWAAHLGLRAVLLPPPSTDGIQYARAVGEMLLAGIGEGCEGQSMTLAMRVPATTDGWLAWNRLRTHCDHSDKLLIALEMSASLGGTEREMDRWIAEPVRFALIPMDVFVRNKSGYPVLLKKHKSLLLALFQHQVQVVLGIHPETAQSDISARVAYIAGLFQSRPPPTAEENFARSHLDCLQAPLQPLQDNLESQTYEVFETDPIKYVRYEEAVLAFLRDRVAAGKSPPFRIMVLGAGRGPLVAASLRAAAKAQVEVSIWAVEKNPNAVHSLRYRRRTEADWRNVEIVAEDMRSWRAPGKADAIVSELLGSFSDNELSPECLDGAQHLLAEDGVSIPTSYLSSLTPVSAPKVWQDARERGDVTSLETAYVVRFHRAFYPSSEIQDCFAFSHPNHEAISESRNDRRAELTFKMDVDALVHGFAGYFDCKLYGDVTLSIRPGQASPGMVSWFPMFFPLSTPLFVRKDEAIRAHFWRRHDSKGVWYEWALSEPVATPVQNPRGRSWSIGL